MTKLTQVFGVSADPVLSYIVRDNIDGLFTAVLKEDKHVVVYGASKQGKTALVSRYLPYDQNVVVRLSPNTNVEDIYSSILRQSGVEIETGTVEEKTSETSATLGIKAKATIWFFGEGEANASGGLKAGDKSQKTSKTIPFNLALAQDIAELLKAVNFKKKIVLENFHYLAEEKQRQLSFDLRSFQEMGIIFVVLGVWRQKDKLRIYCPDLTDRVVDVAVEPWTEGEFRKVAAEGAKCLNIDFAPEVIQRCIENSFGSVGVFQELLKHTCMAAGVSERTFLAQNIADVASAQMAVKEKADQYGATHQQALELISSGNVTHSKEKEKTPLHLPYYLVCAILEMGYAGLEHGISRSDITDKMKQHHHRKDDVRASDMSNLLHNLSTLQHKKGINPPLIDYDIGKRQLYAIDSTFFFFLRNCDLGLVKDELPSPIDASEG
ncbi:hypothetical protein [Stenotrophomonas lactitubi]|uniref:hypothetical protein n=1 Tax=Stenotrophomonas lactitubi TaxID=2045214 RepID=UPI00203AE47A|nr:hypothetical protein [Stenotrophomonas lactitubi]